jgi:uncharacterized repeat protein (TIGR03803 family)
MTNTVQPLGMRLRAVSIALAVAMVLVPTVAATRAQAQTFKVLYTFTGGADGAEPYANLIQDANGNLYGTTLYGGASGYGTVFKLSKSDKETVLHSFTGTGGDGTNPQAGLVRDAEGNVYGTTLYGGASANGTVFKVSKTGKETVLYSFTGTGGDGATPVAGLLRDATGNLYGTTSAGGAYGFGTVFMLDKTGKETVLYSFTETGGDGLNPYAGLVRDAKGNLYGTTFGGGTSGDGTVFVVEKTGKEKVLHSFSGGADGGFPVYGYLVRDSAGNLYGTTEIGGASDRGTIFKLDKTGKETVLYSLADTGGDGEFPVAGLVRDAKGNLYGTTDGGGTSRDGTVFMLDKTGKETVQYSFTGGSDGSGPVAGLVRDAAGNLYGIAAFGGDLSGCSGYGCGTVFKLTP